MQVHPVVFHQVLDLLDVSGWQVRHEDTGLRVLVAGPGDGFVSTATQHAVQAALTAAGVRSPAVHVSVVDAIAAGAAGKRPLVVSRAGQAMLEP